MKSKLFLFVKVIVSITLLTIIITKIDWKSALTLIANANVFLIVVSFFLAFVVRWLMAYKWNVLLRVNYSDIPTWNIVKIIMIGSFLGLFLPSSLSTDVVRGYYLSKENSDKLHITSTIVIDRLLGLLSLLVMGIIGLSLSGTLLKNLNLAPFLFLGVAGIVFIFVILFNKNIFKRVNNFFENKNSKIHNLVEKGYKALSRFYNYPAAMALSFFNSLTIQIIRIFRFYIIALAINVNVPLTYFVIVVPIIMIVLMIPISLGGLGVKEGAAISLLILLGISHNDAIILTLIESITTTIVTMLGGIFYIGYKKNYQNI